MVVMERSGSRHRWLLLVVALLGLAPMAAGSQLSGSIEQLEVALWPEYDRQAVLVMYRFRLKTGSLLPTKVALPIPASVGRPHAVAWQNESGGLMVAEFARVVEDEVALILINMQSLEGQLEYYADLTLEGPRRSFLFSWPGGVDLSAFSYKVQRPLGALGFETAPSPDRRTAGQDGFTYEWIDHGPLKATEKPTIELSYEKDASALSAQALEPSQPPSPSKPASTASTDDNLQPWLLGGFGGVFLGLVVSWYWWSSRKPPEAPHTARGRQAARTEPSENQADKTGSNFCHNCGAKAETRAKFCMSCGTRLVP